MTNVIMMMIIFGAKYDFAIVVPIGAKLRLCNVYVKFDSKSIFRKSFKLSTRIQTNVLSLAKQSSFGYK